MKTREQVIRSNEGIIPIPNLAKKTNANAAEDLLPIVYEELRGLAYRKIEREQPGQTLQATALVHEAWLRLKGNENVKWNSRAHFFGAAAEAMRRILIERARRKKAVRHGAGQHHTDIHELEIAAATTDEEMLALNNALDRLADKDKGKAELVKLRYFVGLTNEEVAEILNLSVPTVKRQWTYARAWLKAEITEHQKL